MKRLNSCSLAAAVVSLLVADAYALQGWICKGTGSMNSIANWSAKVVPTTDQSSSNSAWCFWWAKDFPTVMTLDSDLITDRLIVAGNSSDDKSGSDATFNLGTGRTLTFKGTTGIALRVHGADDVKFRIASGAVNVDSATSDNNCIWFPSSERNYTSGVAGKRNRFVVDGTESALNVPMFYLEYGYDNALVVTNGASFTGCVELSGGNCQGNVFRVSGAGSSFTFTGTGGLFKAFDNQAATDCLVEFNDGAAVSGLQTLVIGGLRTRFRVSGSGTAVATTGSRSTIGDSSGGMTVLEVSDGASFTFGGSDGRFWMGSRSNSPSNTVLVTGAGTTFRAESTSNHILANGSGGQAFVVDDGATSTIGGNFRIGAGAGDGNRFLATGGASAQFHNVYVGHGENGANAFNRFEVRGAGTRVDMAGELKAGFYGVSASNVIAVLDGARVSVVDNMTIGDNGGGNSARVANGAVVTMGQSVMIGKTAGGNNLLEVVGGAVLSNKTDATDFKVGQSTSGNKLRVDGGTVEWIGNMYTGRYGDSSAGTNAVEIVGGGIISIKGSKDFFFFGADNTLVVSNGLLAAREIHLPYFNSSDNSPTIWLRGTNPVLRASGKLQVRRNATVVLAPEGPQGYCEPPFQSEGDLQFISSARFTCDFSSLTMRCGAKCTIARGNPLSIDQDVLTSLAQALPEDYFVKVKNNELVLARKTGMWIVIR